MGSHDRIWREVDQKSKTNGYALLFIVCLYYNWKEIVLVVTVYTMTETVQVDTRHWIRNQLASRLYFSDDGSQDLLLMLRLRMLLTDYVTFRFALLCSAVICYAMQC